MGGKAPTIAILYHLDMNTPKALLKFRNTGEKEGRKKQTKYKKLNPQQQKCMAKHKHSLATRLRLSRNYYPQPETLGGQKKPFL